MAKFSKILRFRFDDDTINFFEQMKKEKKNVSQFVRMAVNEKRNIVCPF
jgi:hypothetical protein